jgi:hypothetical protein
MRVMHDEMDIFELPDDYIKLKTGKEPGDVTIDEYRALMEIFLNLYDPKLKIGAEFDMDNFYRRLSLNIMFDSNIKVGANLRVGPVVMFNDKHCCFENKLKVQCGERMILIENYVDFFTMFGQDMHEMYEVYENNMLFEDIVGKFVFDELNNDIWLVLYQIKSWFTHKIGVEGEPWRIVLSERELSALITFLKNNILVNNTLQFEMTSMCYTANAILRDIVSKTRQEVRNNCKGCLERALINHTCDNEFHGGPSVEDILFKQFDLADADPLNSDKCRQAVIGSMEQFIEPLAVHIMRNLRAEARVVRKFSAGVPLWIQPYETPTLEDFDAMYGGCGSVRGCL